MAPKAKPDLTSKGQKRKRVEPDLSTAPIHHDSNGESFSSGKAISFIVGEERFDIHETLAIMNAPFLADIAKQRLPTIPRTHPSIFRYFTDWLYNWDGNFVFQLKHFRHKGAAGYPYLPLVRCYMLGYMLRSAAFANAVLKKIMETQQNESDVVDAPTIKFLYDTKQQKLKIFSLFVDQAAFYGDEQTFMSYNNLDFVKAILQRLLAIREDKRLKHPAAEKYYVKEIEDPNDCMVDEERSAPPPPPERREGVRVKAEGTT